MAMVEEVNPGAAGWGGNFGASLAASTALLEPQGHPPAATCVGRKTRPRTKQPFDLSLKVDLSISGA